MYREGVPTCVSSVSESYYLPSCSFSSFQTLHRLSVLGAQMKDGPPDTQSNIMNVTTGFEDQSHGNSKPT